MPIPQPNEGESQDDFIGRCMGNDTMIEDYPEQDQRAAVCYSQWSERAAHVEGKAMSTLSEKHRELKRRRSEVVSKMGAIVKQDDDDKPADDDQATAFEAMVATLADLDARIARCEAAMRAEAAIATANNDEDEDEGDKGIEGMVQRDSFRVRGGVDRVPAQAKRDPFKGIKDPRGIRATRYLLGVAHKQYHKVSIEEAAAFVTRRWGDDLVAKELVTRALNTGVTGEGGALIPQDFMADLIELLRALTAVRGSSPMEVGMPMGNLTIPRLAGGATASYQYELDDITVSQEQFDDVNFVAKKLTAMVPVSNDLIRRSPIGVEEIVRDDLVQTIARREDLAFLRGDGTDKGPVGMRSLVMTGNLITVAPLPATPTPGDALSSIIAGSSAAILALQNGMSRMIRPTWIMAPTTARFIATARDQVGGWYYKDEMARGQFEGYPVRLTQQIPTNLSQGASTRGSEIYFYDAADFVIADTYNVVVDASDVASYTDGGSMISAFQRDQSLFRVISEHDVNMRHLQSLVVLLVPDWTFNGVPGIPGRPWSTQPLNPTWSQAGAIRPARATGADAPPALTDPRSVTE